MRAFGRLALTVSVLCACSGEEEAPSVATVDAFASQAHTVACEALFRCGTASNELLVTRALLGDAARCATLRAGAAALGWGDLNELPATVRLGKARYDGAAAFRCLARLRATCDVGHPPAEMCPEVFAGTVAAGGVCQRHEDCAGGGWCDRGRDRRDDLPGDVSGPRGPREPLHGQRGVRPRGRRPAGRVLPRRHGDLPLHPRSTGATATEGMPCGHLVTSNGGLDIPARRGSRACSRRARWRAPAAPRRRRARCARRRRRARRARPAR